MTGSHRWPAASGYVTEVDPALARPAEADVLQDLHSAGHDPDPLPEPDPEPDPDPEPVPEAGADLEEELEL
jgi:hypothetical protein